MASETITSVSVIAKDDYKPEFIYIDATQPEIEFCSYNLLRWR